MSKKKKSYKVMFTTSDSMAGILSYVQTLDNVQNLTVDEIVKENPNVKK